MTRKLVVRLWVVVSALLWCPALYAQKADEIIQKHIAAIGGAANWKKIKTLKVSSVQLSRGKETPMTGIYVQGKAMRWETTVNGMTSYSVITQTNGWRYSPTSSSGKPDAMTATAVKEAQPSLNICGSLIDYKENGLKAVYYGTDDVEGAECHKVKLTFPTGKEQTYYFDVESYYVFRIVEKIKADGKESTSGTNYYGYKKLPEGIVYAMSMKNDRGAPITIKSVEINIPVDESLFKP